MPPSEDPWQRFAQINPWAKDFGDYWQAKLAMELTLPQYKAGAEIFAQNAQPSPLIYIINGHITESAARGETVWFERNVEQNGWLGQYGMFIGANPTKAVAASDVEVLAISPTGVRIIFDRRPDFWETLLQEERARRLRRIPLFGDLEDNELRLLTQVIIDTTFEAETPLPLQTQEGLWGVHWGQLTINGPAAIMTDWRITAGNFIVTSKVLPGSGCEAVSAQAHLRSSVFFLDAKHVQNLAGAFPRVNTLISQPIDMVEIARKIFASNKFRSPIGDNLGDEHFRHLAQFFSQDYTPAGQDITAQGDVGNSIIYVQEGEAVVTGLDGKGRVRPRNYLKAGGWYGSTALLEGKPREANVRAVNTQTLRGATCLSLDRRDLEYAFAEAPQLWHNKVSLRQKFKGLQGPRRRFKWLREGEQLIWYGRKHVLWLFFRIAVVLLVGAPLLALTVTMRDSINDAGVIIMMIVVILFSYLIINDYYDDLYVVTRDRIIRRDRLWWLHFTQNEISTRSIEDVTLTRGFWGGLLGFGDVRIRAAVKESSMVFTQTPDAEAVRQHILDQQVGVKALKLGQRRELMRNRMIRELRLAILLSERQRALGEKVSHPGISSGFWRLLKRLLPGRWRSPKPLDMKPADTTITWRKHWLYLIQRTALPLFLLLVATILGVEVWQGNLQALGAITVRLWIPLFVFAFICLIWLLYQYADYYNDVYILMDDRIIDVEATPLLIFRNKRESPLERIQSINLKQDGIVPNILNYGDVIIRTAATDEGFTFSFVGNPRGVQAEIFRRLDAVRAKKDEQAFEAWGKQLLEGLDVYYGVVDSRDEGRP